MLIHRRFFIASSNELIDLRETTDRLIRKKNDEIVDKGLYYNVERWEDKIGSFNFDGFQERINATLKECDVLIALFGETAGKFTIQEFELAFELFSKRKTDQQIFVYFTKSTNRDSTVEDLREAIRKAGQPYFEFDHEARYELHFGKQIEHLTARFLGQIYINIDLDAIQQQVDQMPSPEQGSEVAMDTSVVRKIAVKIGLLNKTKVNPHLAFQPGDISYFAEMGLSIIDLEVEFRARKLLLERADAVNIKILQPGDLSEKAKPTIDNLRRAWEERYNKL